MSNVKHREKRESLGVQYDVAAEEVGSAFNSQSNTSPMTSTLNGTGTRFYGEREKDIGGTYITTKWFVVLWVPVLPLSSWRVYPLGPERVDYIIEESSGTSQALQATRVPLNLKQVFNVYAVAACGLVPTWFVLHRMFPGWI